jgi:hypothetical protein
MLLYIKNNDNNNLETDKVFVLTWTVLCFWGICLQDVRLKNLCM